MCSKTTKWKKLTFARTETEVHVKPATQSWDGKVTGAR